LESMVITSFMKPTVSTSLPTLSECVKGCSDRRLLGY
jgi:hypothetical protein